MRGSSVLIAAFSGRSLSQSARRAGYAPLVVDAFADEDTVEAAEHYRCMPHALRRGFRLGSLSRALRELSDLAETPPLGLVLGTGFEDQPKLIAQLADLFPLLSCPASVVQRIKDPDAFFRFLRSAGIRHPETQVAPPNDPGGWISKRVGGSGGLHIEHCRRQERARKSRYFQRLQRGTPISAMVICSTRSHAFAFSRQWYEPAPQHPFRYGGATGWIELDADTEARIVDTALKVSNEFSLTGLVSFDFLVADGEPLLLEVNPRPGASLDVLDDARGSLFSAHLDAFGPTPDPAQCLTENFIAPPARAAAYVYADRGPLCVQTLEWPHWVADRPTPGSRIAQYQPVATVFAEAPTADEAERLCRHRLGLLTDMLYEGQKGKELD